MTTQMQREIHLTGKDLMGMVQLRPQDIGKYAIIPGPKERLDGFLKNLEKPIKNFSFMEYTMYTGEYEGTKITSINGGRFSADTAITTEILCSAQARTMVRIGSCGALNENIKIGDLIVADSAIRGEGVTPYYVDDPKFQPSADKNLTDALYESAKASGYKVHRGRVWSTDAILRETREYVGKAINKGAIAVDMVTSVFLTICQLYKIPATAILAVSDHIITGEMGFMDANYYMAEHAMIGISLDLVKRLEGKTKAKV
ncbi:MAG: hypothetical protein JW847_03355 [Candidatus Omnitrophica bacterium]|nr:hypothetical protein [Candidatus Omnitrophota bacterium]